MYKMTKGGNMMSSARNTKTIGAEISRLPVTQCIGRQKRFFYNREERTEKGTNMKEFNTKLRH